MTAVVPTAQYGRQVILMLDTDLVVDHQVYL